MSKKKSKTFRRTLIRNRQEAIKNVFFHSLDSDVLTQAKSRVEANRDAIHELLEADSPIEIEEILGMQLPNKPEFADISQRVAKTVMDKIMMKFATDVPLEKIEALYLGNCLVSMFELGADSSLAFNHPNRPGRRTDFTRNIDITYQFCRLVASKMNPSKAYDELEQEFHLDRRQIIDIVKENEGFVREYYPFADEPLWK